MNLQKFIAESLDEIMSGLKEAQDKLTAKESHARICPTLALGNPELFKGTFVGRNPGGRAISIIEYDIAVEVTNDGGGGGKISVTAGIVSAEGAGDKKHGDKVASRIKFTVPVVYPDLGN